MVYLGPKQGNLEKALTSGPKGLVISCNSSLNRIFYFDQHVQRSKPSAVSSRSNSSHPVDWREDVRQRRKAGTSNVPPKLMTSLDWDWNLMTVYPNRVP